MAPIFGYYFDGGYYPRGSTQRLADALVEAIHMHGGEVRLRAAVRRILIEGGRAVGVLCLPTAACTAPVAAISNADLQRTLLELIGDECLPAKLRAEAAAIQPSTSAFMVFLGVDFVPEIAPLSVVQDDNESVAIAIPSLVDPRPPGGYATVTSTTLIPQSEAPGWNRLSPGYAVRKREQADRMIALAERAIPGLGSHIVYRQEGSPATLRVLRLDNEWIYLRACNRQAAEREDPYSRAVPGRIGHLSRCRR